MTDESDARIFELAQLLAAPLYDHESMQRVAPGVTALELFAALTVVIDTARVRLAELEPAARAERVQQLGGVN